MTPFNIFIFFALIFGWVVLFLWILAERSRSKSERKFPAPMQSNLPAAPMAPAASPTPEVRSSTSFQAPNANVRKPVAPRAKLPMVTSAKEGVLLLLEVPKENEKTPLAAELMFASLHGIYQEGGVADYFSFEIDATEKAIKFLVWVPRELQGYMEGQLYAQYPDINITELNDTLPGTPAERYAAWEVAEIGLEKDQIVPIRTFQTFEVDPLAAITAAVSKLSKDERIMVQVFARPIENNWRDDSLKYIEKVRAGKSNASLLQQLSKELGGVLIDAAKGAVGLSSEAAAQAENKGLPPGVEEVLKAIEEKSAGLGFSTGIRILSMGPDQAKVRSRLQLAVAAFRQFNSNSLNGFKVALVSNEPAVYNWVKARVFPATSFIMNVTELASIYHLPNVSVATPDINWAGSKKGNAPANVPLWNEETKDELTLLARTNFRGNAENFGIKVKDRRRHIYVVGKSGVGKSTLLENMTISDIRNGRGVGVIDPHGEYADKILDYIPSNRINDVVLFDVSDRENPVAFNVLEVRSPEHKAVVASGVVSVFKKIFGESWGPRLEYWLRNTILALLDYPDATLMMVPKMLADAAFRRKVIDNIKDPVLKSNWENEFEKMQDKQKSETIDPILNKVGQFLSSPIIRNIVGQPNSTIDMRAIMDEGKIMLVKLPKGLIGEDNATLLGAFVVTQIQLAALSRADIEESERRDFYLYVDEFQNFATEAFETILSEARKYHLSLTMAHQYMSQLEEGVRNAVIGNVGTIISFRVGADDAPQLIKEFSPVFEEDDLVNLSIFNIYVKLSVDGLTTTAFSAQTLPLPEHFKTGSREKAIQVARERYSKKREFVEGKLAEFAEMINELNELFEEDRKKKARSQSAEAAAKYGYSGERKGGGGGGGFRSGQGGGFNRPSSAPAPRPATSTAPAEGLQSIVQKLEKKLGSKLDDGKKEELKKEIENPGGFSDFKAALQNAAPIDPNKTADKPKTDTPAADLPVAVPDIHPVQGLESDIPSEPIESDAPATSEDEKL